MKKDIKKISSVSNPEIKFLKSLATSKGRKQHKKFIAEGFNVCKTFLQAGYKPQEVYCLASIQQEVTELCPIAHMTLITEHVGNAITQQTTFSGLCMVFAIPAPPPANKLSEGIVLYEIADPGNMGTLLRTAAAMSVKTAVIVNGVDPWSPKVIQSSVGTLAFLNIFVISWQELLSLKHNLKLCGLVVEGGSKPKDLNFSNTLLIIGNEAHGIPEMHLKQCDMLLTIEMPGKTESLNAAVAGSIALYLAWHTT